MTMASNLCAELTGTQSESIVPNAIVAQQHGFAIRCLSQRSNVPTPPIRISAPQAHK